MADSLYWIWFQQLFGYGTVRSEELLTAFRHPGSLYESSLPALREGGLLTKAELERVASSSLEPAREIYEACRTRGIAVITPDDEAYPLRLQNIYARPAVLYVQGELGRVDELPHIAIVGTRRFTEYGRRVAEALARELAGSGFVVVSGMAAGIDTFCHVGALKASGRTIAVTGCGADTIYPASNTQLHELICKSGAVVSEFPPQVPPLPYHFPIRNRIVSGLSLGVVVVEGRRRSGSLITAGHAMTQGRDVFAVPGSIFSPQSEGPHWLIRQGAIPVTDVQDIIKEYLHLFADTIDSEKSPKYNIDCRQTVLAGTVEQAQPIPEPQPAPKEPPLFLTAQQRAIFQAMGNQPRTAEELTAMLDMPVKDLLAGLTQLEIYGLLQAQDGRTFTLL